MVRQVVVCYQMLPSPCTVYSQAFSVNDLGAHPRRTAAKSRSDHVNHNALVAQGSMINRNPLLCSRITCQCSLVPSRSLLPRSPSKVWERAGEYLSVTSQLKVESRIDRAENAWGLGWCQWRSRLKTAVT